MQEIVASEAWRTMYPEASIGILAMRDVINPVQHAVLDKHKQELEAQLRSHFSGYDRAGLKALPALQAYGAYYKRFKKTYHIQLQLESVVLKGKSIPNVAALVEAMFMAELKNLLLTAGHDLELVQSPITIDVADGSEHFIRINGQEQEMKPGDMMITDAQGILSSVIYGPDHRTRITPETRRALFTVYAPQGIEEQAIRQHLHDIRDNVLIIAPEAQVMLAQVYCST